MEISDEIPIFSDSDDSMLDPNVILSDLTGSSTDTADENIDVSNLSTETNELNHLTHKKLQKKLRNEGKAYMSSSGKMVPCRAVRDLQSCRNMCRNKITPEQRQDIHYNYWQLGSYQLRQAFVAGLIETHEPKTVRTNKSLDKPRNRVHTYKYFLEVNGQRILVCQKCFRLILSESEQFCKTTIKKKIQGNGIITRSDRRGKHSNPKKLTPGKELEIVNFINSFPSYESHYTRRDTSKRYMSSDLSVAELYRLYCENNDHIISLSKFTQIFQTLNIKFKKPKLDTCHKCDLFKAKIAVTQGEPLDVLKSEQANHHKEAEEAYEAKKNDKQKAMVDTKIKVLAFDLQQCLPTPLLRSSISFYKRPLWTFNLTVHDCGTNEPFCYMWHEALAKRGGNEIASCVFQHLLSLHSSIKHVILYSDCCPGQNKNSYVATMYSIFMQLADTNVEVIDYKFMVPGHTHMECDSDHALIEKKKKSTSIAIHHPRDWFQFIRTVGIKKKFYVHEMKRDQFLDFANAAKEFFVWRKVDDEGLKYTWANIKWLRFTKQFGTISFKYTLDENAQFRTINLRKRGINSILTNNLKLCYSSPIPINSKKKKDLIDMLPLIDEIYRHFYTNLITEEILDFHPDLTESDEIFE